MLNASDHVLQLLCPVPPTGVAVTSFPPLHRYYVLFYDVRRRPTFPRWNDLRLALPPQLHVPLPTASLWLSLLLLLFCCSLLLARYFVLRSIREEEDSDTDRVDSTSGSADSLHHEADADSYADDWPENVDDDTEADLVLEGEALLFLSKKETHDVADTLLVRQGQDAPADSSAAAEPDTTSAASVSVYASPMESLTSDKPEPDAGLNPVTLPVPNYPPPTRAPPPIPNSASTDAAAATVDEKKPKAEVNLHRQVKNFLEGEKGFSSTGTVADDARLIRKGFKPREEEEDQNLVGYDSSTVGSTSKSSGEWRSSTNLRDSETEHLFSSSSRKSSSKWESYAVFRKYDEEMMFFDRITAQKLNEAESLRSVKVHPRSISQRIVHKLTTREKHFARFKDPYRELEAAYVAQICLTWEALNWNYKYFKQLHADRREEDEEGCSAHVAQQFQQFQVLLQRFIENEPYECGRRPEVYARMRIAAPRLLQVPEFHDSEDRKDKENLDSRFPSTEFLVILEDAIRTFMNFLRADRENHWQMLKALVKKRSSSVDLVLLHLLRKVNEKKRRRLKDLIRRGKCPRKRKPQGEEEMEILMALIDMKIVSRVLRMPEISEEQLHWCEEKMSRVKVWDGRMQRDSSPLFFPAH